MPNTPSQEEIERAVRWVDQQPGFTLTRSTLLNALALYAQSERKPQREVDARVAAKQGHYQGYKIAEEIREGEGKGEL